MGRDYYMTYVLEIAEHKPDGTHGRDLLAAWIVGDKRNGWGSGKPTNKNLAEYMEKYITSLMSNGANAHLTRDGYVPIPHAARIIHQRTNEVLATWKDNESFRTIW